MRLGDNVVALLHFGVKGISVESLFIIASIDVDLKGEFWCHISIIDLDSGCWNAKRAFNPTAESCCPYFFSFSFPVTTSCSRSSS